MKAYILIWENLNIYYIDVVHIKGEDYYCNDLERLFTLGTNLFFTKEDVLKAFKELKYKKIMQTKALVTQLEQLEFQIKDI